MLTQHESVGQPFQKLERWSLDSGVTESNGNVQVGNFPVERFPSGDVFGGKNDGKMHILPMPVLMTMMSSSPMF